MTELQISLVDIAAVQQAFARILGRVPRSITPDAIAEILGPVVWKPAEGWDSQPDGVVASNAGLFDAGFSGSVLVVTDASFFPDRGAFRIDSKDLPAFVSQHSARYQECFFDGDAIVVEEHGCRIWIFHHEGVYACT